MTNTYKYCLSQQDLPIISGIPNSSLLTGMSFIAGWPCSASSSPSTFLGFGLVAEDGLR